MFLLARVFARALKAPTIAPSALSDSRAGGRGGASRRLRRGFGAGLRGSKRKQFESTCEAGLHTFRAVAQDDTLRRLPLGYVIFARTSKDLEAQRHTAEPRLPTPKPNLPSPKPGPPSSKPNFQSPKPRHTGSPEAHARRGEKSWKPRHPTPKPNLPSPKPSPQSPKPSFQSPKPNHRVPKWVPKGPSRRTWLGVRGFCKARPERWLGFAV